MNVTTTKFGSRRSARQGFALFACLATVLLGGCSLKRCATWDRVTAPDYMHEENTTLHGFHRTSWDSWPEEYHHNGWSQRADAHVKHEEKLPASEPSQELPHPEMDDDSIELPEQDATPEARAPRPNIGKRPAAKPLATTQAEQPAAETVEPDVELVAGVMALEAETPVMEIPLSLDSASSPWTDRFASLIAEDRKTKWRALNGQAIEAQESLATSEQEDASPESTPLEIVPEPQLEETPTAPTHGDGAVQFRLPATKSEMELPEAGDSTPMDDETQSGATDHE